MIVRRSAEDVAAWVRFASAAEAAANKPVDIPTTLDRAVQRARKAVLPCEPMAPSNPWVIALRMAERFCGMLAIGRLDMAGDLRFALEQAQAHCKLHTEHGAANGHRVETPRPAPRLPYAED